MIRINLFFLIYGHFHNVDWDSYCDETDKYNVDEVFDIIPFYARVLELGIWAIIKVLELRADLLLYNETPMPIQMLAIAALYIDLLWSIKNSEGKDSLVYFLNSSGICHKYLQMVSRFVQKLKVSFCATKLCETSYIIL